MNEIDIDIPDEECDDSVEMLTATYERKRRSGFCDIFAMQTVICVLLSAAAFVMNIMYPDIFGQIFGILTDFTDDENEIMPDVIEMVMAYWQK
jgi:Na+/proline symporter